MMVPAEPARRDALGHLVQAPAASAPARPRSAPRPTRSSSFLEIGHVADELAGNLSGGQKKLLELGRTMMVDAKIVFLDEVGAGVNRTLLSTIGDAILQLNRERGYTFCLVEHDMDFIGRLCGTRSSSWPRARCSPSAIPSEVMKNEAVIEAYLGRGLKNKPARARKPVAVTFLVGEAMTGGYGSGADILHACTIAVDRGEIAVIVGPNGAGKSTAMKAVFGMLPLRSGRVTPRRPRHHQALAAGARARRHGLRAADLERLRLDDGRGEPRDGRLHPRRRLLRDHGAGLRPLPDPASRSAASPRASSPAASASRSPSAGR